ncbi:MAG: hypothetical protein BV456_04785 [Thermoplasmata archaeon M8B2D]|nr:MAG: hypothetical protein BV456_04785 [Thermoplasmata archaeon M8B2D]
MSSQRKLIEAYLKCNDQISQNVFTKLLFKTNNWMFSPELKKKLKSWCKTTLEVISSERVLKFS